MLRLGQVVRDKDESMKGGSTPKHGEKKKGRTVYVTDDSWEVLDLIAREFMLSKSELVEMIGQKRLKIIRNDQTENQVA